MCLVSTAEVLRRSSPLRAVAGAHPRAAAVEGRAAGPGLVLADGPPLELRVRERGRTGRVDEVTGEAGQTRYFSCSIGQHCRDGQVLTVEWVNGTAAPTPAQKKDDSDDATQRAVAAGLYISLAAAAALPFLG